VRGRPGAGYRPDRRDAARRDHRIYHPGRTGPRPSRLRPAGLRPAAAAGQLAGRHRVRTRPRPGPPGAARSRFCPSSSAWPWSESRSPGSPRSQAARTFRARWTEPSSADTAPQPSGTSRSR
jgi:hypothetical protein